MGLCRLVRFVRVVVNGRCTALITSIDDDYILIDVDGVAECSVGYVYIYFPTLT